MGRESKKQIPFKTASKRTKQELTWGVKDLYTQNYKTLIKIREDDLKKYTIFLVLKKRKKNKQLNQKLACVCVPSHFNCVWLFATPRTAARQAPLSMGTLQARILEWVEKWKIELSYDPAIPLLGICPGKPQFKKIHAPQCSLQH